MLKSKPNTMGVGMSDAFKAIKKQQLTVCFTHLLASRAQQLWQAWALFSPAYTAYMWACSSWPGITVTRGCLSGCPYGVINPWAVKGYKGCVMPSHWLRTTSVQRGAAAGLTLAVPPRTAVSLCQQLSLPL